MVWLLHEGDAVQGVYEDVAAALTFYLPRFMDSLAAAGHLGPIHILPQPFPNNEGVGQQCSKLFGRCPTTRGAALYLASDANCSDLHIVALGTYHGTPVFLLRADAADLYGANGGAVRPHGLAELGCVFRAAALRGNKLTRDQP
jgi:hypothetical protein